MPGVNLNRRGFIASAACLVSTASGVAMAGTDFDQKPASVISESPQRLPGIGQASDLVEKGKDAQDLAPPRLAATTSGQPEQAAEAPVQTSTAPSAQPTAPAQPTASGQPTAPGQQQAAEPSQPPAARAKAEPVPAAPAEAKLAEEAGLSPPKGKVILTVSGKITITNAGNTARFDRQMLESLGMSRFTTTTPWYNTPVTFEGVRLDQLMKTVGAAGELLRARALDDYTTEIPITDFEHYATILALKRDGNYMPVTDKGPLFIVYPFDSNPDLKHQRFYARSAWQVARMIVT